MKTIKDFFNLSFSTKLIIGTYLFFIIRLHLKSGLQYQTLDLQNIIVLLTGILSVVIIFKLIEFLIPQKKNLNAIVKISMLSLYVWIGHYHLRSRTNLDFAVMADNAGAAFYAESLMVIADIFTKKDIATNILVVLFSVFIEFKKKKISTNAKQDNPQRNILISLFLYSFLLIVPPYSYDEFTSFNQSIYRYYFPDSRFQIKLDPNNPYPYVKTNLPSFSSVVNERPNIFIIMVESFNFNYILKKTATNKEYTPFFNSLVTQGLFFDNFWGNSVQTARGQLSILCSIPTITRQQVFTHYPKLKLNCISNILKNEGYDTLFFKAYSDITFDNTGEFIKHNGFDHIHAMTNEIKNKYSKNISEIKSWGWGIQDNFFYKIFFNYLDELHSKNVSKQNDRKIFATLTTVSNHQKFNDVPPDQRYIFKEPSNITEHYANSLRVTDEYLKTFFEELEKRNYLKNSIIIITGDHSFPMGEHYSYAAENGFYTENFKTPFLIIWKANNKFIGVDHTPRSQLDIAPTILDILGISTLNHFVGTSMFQKEESFIPLIQPYAGYYIGSLNYPFKYMYHGKTKREYLFDLKEDPLEQNNLIEESNLQSVIDKARNDTTKILLNDALIKQDKIWKQSSRF